MQPDDWKKFSKDCYSYMNRLSKDDQDKVRGFQRGDLMGIPRNRNGGFSVPAYASTAVFAEIQKFLRVLQDAPKLPKKCTVYRAMHVHPRKDKVFNCFPTSTTINMSYAIEWLITQKQSIKYVYKIEVPSGTPCLFIGIASEAHRNNFPTTFWNTNRRYSNCVVHQGELIVPPNILHTGNTFMKNMKTIDITKYGIHYIMNNLKTVLQRNYAVLTEEQSRIRNIINRNDWKVHVIPCSLERIQDCSPQQLHWKVTGRGANYHITKNLPR
jgi:hypothetical protein